MKVKLLEALTPEQREEVDNWDQPHHKFSDHAFPSPSHSRVSVDLGSVGKGEHEDEISGHLSKHGYTMHDYREGLAKDKFGRLVKIGKALGKTGGDHLLTKFTGDPVRQQKSGHSDLHVVISRHPYDVAGMTSKGHSWEHQSCMNFEDGQNRRYLPSDVEAGTHVAYLTHKDDHEIERPVARIALKPFTSRPGGSKILRPERRVYGNAPSSFESTIDGWANKHFPADPEKIYKKHSSVYDDSNQGAIFGRRTLAKSAETGEVDHIQGALNQHHDLTKEEIEPVVKNFPNIAAEYRNLHPDHVNWIAQSAHVDQEPREVRLAHYALLKTHSEKLSKDGYAAIRDQFDKHAKSGRAPGHYANELHKLILNHPHADPLQSIEVMKHPHADVAPSPAKYLGQDLRKSSPHVNHPDLLAHVFANAHTDTQLLNDIASNPHLTPDNLHKVFQKTQEFTGYPGPQFAIRDAKLNLAENRSTHLHTLKALHRDARKYDGDDTYMDRRLASHPNIDQDTANKIFARTLSKAKSNTDGNHNRTIQELAHRGWMQKEHYEHLLRGKHPHADSFLGIAIDNDIKFSIARDEYNGSHVMHNILNRHAPSLDPDKGRATEFSNHIIKKTIDSDLPFASIAAVKHSDLLSHDDAADVFAKLHTKWHHGVAADKMFDIMNKRLVMSPRFKEIAANSVFSTVQRAYVRSNHATPEHLEKFIDRGAFHPETSEAAAYNKNSFPHIDKILDHLDPNIVKAGLSHGGIQEHHLDRVFGRLSKEHAENLLVTATEGLTHPKAQPRHFVQAISAAMEHKTSANPFRYHQAVKALDIYHNEHESQTDPAPYHEALKHIDSPSGDALVPAMLAKKTPRVVWDTLANHSDASYRARVAKSNHAPHDVLEKLSFDSNARVARDASQNPRHKNASEFDESISKSTFRVYLLG